MESELCRMSTETCRRVSCCNVNGVEFSPFQYSLVNGTTYTNDEMTFTIHCPSGYDCTADSVVVVIPPGTIKFTPTQIDPNPPRSGSDDPWNPAPGVYDFNCGSETLTIRTDGTGFTNDQINQIITFLAQCQANKDGYDELLPTPIFTPSGAPGIRLWNTEQTCTATCPEGETGDPVTVTIPANTNSVIVAAAASPLEKYLAQQTLNNAAYNQACAQAEEGLSCAAPACPELLDTISIGGGVCIQAAHDPVGNTVFISNFTSSAIYQIDPVGNTVLASVPMPSNPCGIVYVPGPTTVSSDPALIVSTFNGNLYHIDISTLTVTLLGVLTASTLSATAYSFLSDKVFIPISNPTGGMDVYTVSTGAVAHISGTTVPLALAYNPDLNEVYTTNFDPVTYPGVSMLAINAAFNTITKQYTMSLPDHFPGGNSIAYASSVGKIFIGGRRASTLENNLFVVNSVTFLEEDVVALPSATINVVPSVHFNPNMSIVLVGVTQSTLAANSIQVHSPITNQTICALAGLNTVGRGTVAANTSLYIQIRYSLADLQVGQIGPSP